jgi:ribose 1,5-bisphosphokinase PhnN
MHSRFAPKADARPSPRRHLTTPLWQATRRGARMLRTALGLAIATWLEDPAVVEVNASRTRFDIRRRASADLKSWQNKEKC